MPVGPRETKTSGFSVSVWLLVRLDQRKVLLPQGGSCVRRTSSCCGRFAVDVDVAAHVLEVGADVRQEVAVPAVDAARPPDHQDFVCGPRWTPYVTDFVFSTALPMEQKNSSLGTFEKQPAKKLHHNVSLLTDVEAVHQKL